jgi:hypothetical protein
MQFNISPNIRPDLNAQGFYTGMFVKAPVSFIEDNSAGSAGGESGVQSNTPTIPSDIYVNLTADYDPANVEFGLVEFKDGYQITFTGSSNTHISRDRLAEVYNQYRNDLELRYGNASLEFLKPKVRYIAHTHPNAMGIARGKGIFGKPIYTGKEHLLGPSESDYNTTKIVGLPHYVIDTSQIFLIDPDGTPNGSWWWRNGGDGFRFNEPGGGGESSQPHETESQSENRTVFYLQDQNNNIYPLSLVNMLWSSFTSSDGKKRLPKFFENDEKGNTIKEGSIVVLTFLNKDYLKPLVLGCLESFGGQHNIEHYMNSSFDYMDTEVDINKNEEFTIRRTVSAKGDVFIEIENNNDKGINYHINVKGENSQIFLNSGGDFIAGSDHNKIHIIDDKIFIGSDEYLDKAKETGINSEKIWLGTSTFYDDELKMDNDSAGNEISGDTAIENFISANLNNAQRQPSVLGAAVVFLVRELVDIWSETKYQSGNTICLVSAEDKQKMITRVRNKIPKILSKVVSLIKNKDD